MQTIQRLFRAFSLRQFLAVTLTGMLVLTSVACNAPQAAAPAEPNPSTTGQDMYPHQDTTRDTSAADAKAERMVRQAEQRIQTGKSPKDLVDEVTPDKSLEQQAKDVGQSAKQAAENVGKSTQRAAENAAENTQSGLKTLKESAEDVADRAANAVDSATPETFPNS
ncbi:MAG: hypothetical protein WBA43_08665 [Elainellaceae cyanobacterium]